ncbi:hypothetical protein LSCM1_05231 [Leishmania martiniquensis]|uniref:DUF1308 domain-containing protein n=1 Tax=Leishmania martiniquensis TaxID=1580590 RepID=A0A836KI95_9TRYP|nr:hypothetical protein LSCM1_05231 [Leishmania martiniquensis]
MEQLYMAVPVPSSGDDEDTQEGWRLDVSAHCSGASSGSRSCTNSADTSSAAPSATPGETPEDDEDSFGRSCYAAHHRRSRRPGESHRAFTASNSPTELYLFLVQLLRVSEDLRSRLERIASKTAVSLEAVSQHSQASHSRADGRGYHAFRDRARGGGKGAALAGHQGIAKLRRRLSKETTHVQRAVEGLSAAGCTGVPGSGSSDSLAIPPAIFEAAVTCAQCNSLSHYECIVTCLERESDVTGVYVPVSRYVGPPQHVPRGSANGAGAVQEPFSRKDMRLEVDVISSNGHRWIKVKTATARNLELEAAALEVNGSTAFTDMLLGLVEGSRRACLPHRRAVQVAVVLLYRPPPLLEKFFAAHRIVWAALPAFQVVTVPRWETRARQPFAAPTPSAATWLPPLAPSPSFICLDTTALVTLCSQSCYADYLPYSVRMERLASFHVLQEQQRKEAEECRAVVAVLEPVLRSYTAWYTKDALEQKMRRALLCSRDTVGAETPSASAVEKRAQVVPLALILSTELDWLDLLERDSRQPPADSGGADTCRGTAAAPTTATAPSPELPFEESSLLREYSGRLERGAASSSLSLQERPNWIIADVTYKEFKWILETIAGPQEVARAARLLRLVSVVDTSFLRDSMLGRGGGEDSHATPRGSGEDAGRSHAFLSPMLPPLFTFVENLRLSGKVSGRNKMVFGLADAVDAVMVTSNEQLCCAAREQGIHVEACFHPSRSLTELKMYGLLRRHGPGKPPAVTF